MTAKPRKCRIKAAGCQGTYWPTAGRLAPCCYNVECMTAWAARQFEKKRAKEKSAAMVEHRAAKEKIKRPQELNSLCQQVFNAFIRERDHGYPCICHPGSEPMYSRKFGGEIDAGHYRSRGSAKHMRFIENNCHAQRKSCNRNGGRRDQYRAGLIERIGLEAVEALEADHTVRKYSPDDYREMIAYYREETRRLRKCRETGRPE